MLCNNGIRLMLKATYLQIGTGLIGLILHLNWLKLGAS